MVRQKTNKILIPISKQFSLKSKLPFMKIILTTGIAVFALAFASQAQNKNFIDQPFIEVVGNADTLLTPNQIFIAIRITEKDTKDKISVEEQETKMISTLKSLGINTATDLTSSDMFSDFKTYLFKSKDIMKSKSYILKVTTAQMASTVFVKLEEIGISNTSIDRVDHSNLKNIQNECRTKAVENAKWKALSMVKPLGQSLGNAIYMTEDHDQYKSLNSTQSVKIRKTSYGSVDRSFEAPEIDFEKIKVSSSVQVKFILK
jgi:uncharacterized protein YggE